MNKKINSWRDEKWVFSLFSRVSLFTMGLFKLKGTLRRDRLLCLTAPQQLFPDWISNLAAAAATCLSCCAVLRTLPSLGTYILRLYITCHIQASMQDHHLHVIAPCSIKLVSFSLLLNISWILILTWSNITIDIILDVNEYSSILKVNLASWSLITREKSQEDLEILNSTYKWFISWHHY